MNKTELIKELRALTSAGMSDCKSALDESNWDLQAAVDIVKAKGLNIADGRTGRAASEGKLILVDAGNQKALIEINSQTDFVANSPDFQQFAGVVEDQMLLDLGNPMFQFHHDSPAIEVARKELVAKTKENIVVRRWWVEQALAATTRTFSYLHSNSKIGVLLTMLAPNMEALNAPSFAELGDNLAMQIAAMNPLAVSSEQISSEDIERQRVIFQTQLQELNKPPAAWPKIMEGKFRKWHSEVCLIDQEAVWLTKTSVKQAVDKVSSELGGPITALSFIRAQVGEGIEIAKDNLAEEVAKLTGSQEAATLGIGDGLLNMGQQ